MSRNYRDYSITEIASSITKEIIETGRSAGWCGSLEDLGRVKASMALFNIAYVDDFLGEWGLERT